MHKARTTCRLTTVANCLMEVEVICQTFSVLDRMNIRQWERYNKECTKQNFAFCHCWFRGCKKCSILSGLCCSFSPNHPSHFPILPCSVNIVFVECGTKARLSNCINVTTSRSLYYGCLLHPPRRVAKSLRFVIINYREYDDHHIHHHPKCMLLLWFKWNALFWLRFADSSVHFHCSDALILSAFLLLRCCQPLALICTATQLSLTAVNYCNLL